MGELIFEYSVLDDSFQVWETPPGVTIRDPDWRLYGQMVESGRVDWDHTWQMYKAICERRDADYRGERAEQLKAFLDRRTSGDHST